MSCNVTMDAARFQQGIDLGIQAGQPIQPSVEMFSFARDPEASLPQQITQEKGEGETSF